ncbi:MAG: helix-turn-helix domain-containing protein [Planctomycetota bacterium]|nr:helix-turn-helix domain-containing protein [Planctomycetota bacterium]
MAQLSFAVLLKRARKRAGLTQDALGKKAGLTGSYISMIESGRKPAPRSPVITRLCKALGIREKHFQDAAALERAPDPIRRRIEKIERDEQSAQRHRDRLLSTTLFHLAHRGPVSAATSFLDLSPAQRGLLGRLLGRARTARSPEDAERRSGEVLEEASGREREMLARVLPAALAKAPTDAPEDTATEEEAGPRTLPIHGDLARGGKPSGHHAVDPALWHEQAFLWRVSGDDAYPRIEAGDLLLIDPLAEPKSGDLVAIHHKGQDHVRLLHVQDDQVRLEPPRPDMLPIRMALSRFKPAGVVVWMCRALR